MNSTLKSALPVAVICAVLVALVMAGYSYWLKGRVMREMADKQRLEISEVRAAHQADMDRLAERILAQVSETNKTLDAAIASRASDLFLTEEENRRLDEEKVGALADAVMTRLNAVIPTPEDQDRSYTTISSRVAEQLDPILSDIARTGNLNRSDVEFYSRQISGLIDGLLKEELAEKQKLNTAVVQTSALAQDSMRLSQEISALYLSSLKDEGLLSRLLILPVRVVQDVTSLSIVGSSDRRKMEERMFNELGELERRLQQVQATLPRSSETGMRFEVTETEQVPEAETAAPAPPAAPAAPVRAKPTTPAPTPPKPGP